MVAPFVLLVDDGTAAEEEVAAPLGPDPDSIVFFLEFEGVLDPEVVAEVGGGAIELPEEGVI